MFRKTTSVIFTLLLWIGAAAFSCLAEDDKFLGVLRSRLAELPVLTASSEPGSPRFTVMRLNAPSIYTGGERYGAVKVVCPVDQPVALCWLFSDTTNIDEYGLLSSEGVRLEPEFSRFIHPATANADPEQELAGRRMSSLPRPWDMFQLHMLGVASRHLKPGGEYIIWFRFSDQRPTDILLAATFVEPAMKLDSGDLPPIFGLPTLIAP